MSFYFSYLPKIYLLDKMNLFQYRVTHVEWWGCLTDYPSSWPWASQHRPCFGIGIYCFQSEPIPENHLKTFWFCVWKNCELSSCWCTCHSRDKWYLSVVWTVSCLNQLSAQLSNTMVPAGVILHCMRRGQLCGMARWLLDVRITYIHLIRG